METRNENWKDSCRHLYKYPESGLIIIMEYTLCNTACGNNEVERQRHNKQVNYTQGNEEKSR